MVGAKAIDEENGKALQAIVIDSISLEILLEEFNTSIIKLSNRERMLKQGKKEEASYLIECYYTSDINSISLEISCTRIKDESNIFSDAIVAPLDLELDLAIRNSIKKLLVLLQTDIKENPRLITRIKEEVPGEFKHLYFSLGAAPFIPLGEVRNYFSIGGMSELNLLYRAPASFGNLGYGIHLSGNYFQAEGDLNSSDTVFLAGGPEFRPSVTITNWIDLYLRANGGLSIFMIRTEETGFQNTLIPYISAGGGTAIKLSRDFGLVISCIYYNYFEKSLLISGLSPTIGLYLIK